MTVTGRAPAIAVIFATVLLNMIGFGVIMPVMPQLIMDVTGGDIAEAARWGGVMSAVYALMQFFASPVLGALSDRFGRRPVILGSLAAYSLDFLLLALAPTITVLIAARILAGAFSATFSTANAFIADISPPEKRAGNFGLIGAAFGLGFIVGPAIGGALGETWGPRAPFYFVALLGALNFVAGWFLLPESLAAANRRPFEWRRANAFGAFRQFRKYPSVLPIAFAVFLYQTGHWTFPSVWAYFAEERFGWTPGSIAASLVAVGLAAAVVQGGLTRLVVPRIGEQAAAYFSLCVALVCQIAYAFVTEGWMVYLVIPLGALAGFVLPALQGLMSRATPPDAQGELQGGIAALGGLSMMVGPLMMTQVFAAFSSPEAPIVMGPFVIAPEGSGHYFPGAPFLVAAALTGLAIMQLLSSSRAAARAATPAAGGGV